MTSVDSGLERWAWEQLTGRPKRRPGPLVPWVLTVAPVLVQLYRLGAPGRSLATIAAAGFAGAWTLRRAPTVLPAVVAAIGSVVLITANTRAGLRFAFIAAVALPVWSVALGSLRSDSARFPSRASYALATLPLGVGSILLVLADGTRLPFYAAVASAAIAVVVLAVGAHVDPLVVPLLARIDTVRSSRPLATVTQFVDRVAVGFGRVVGAVVMVLPAIVVELTWLVQRIVRLDPLSPPVRPGTRWVERSVAIAPFPERLYTAAPVVDPRGGLRRAHQMLAGALVTALFVLPPVGYARAKGYGYSFENGFSVNGGRPAEQGQLREDQDCTTVGSGGDDDPVMGQDPGWPRVACEVGVFATTGQFDATTTYRFPDYAGTWLNVEDGERRTWRPPECDCQRLTVWWFGGSAAWGYWQRDEFSLPSQIAKAAWERGIALDIHNYAMPGWVIGQEARRFAELAAAGDAPDLVVYYDGGNELNRQKDRNGEGRGRDESETSFAEVQLDDVLHNGPFPFGEEHVARGSSWPADDPELPPSQVAHHAMNRYARGIDLAKLLAASVGTTPVFLWQPLLPSSPANAGDENVMTPEDRDAWRGMLPQAFAEMPDGVINLSSSLDDVDRLVFKDVWHTNELGADVVARDIDRRLADTYDSLVTRSRPG